jgi:hypothetical protein
MIAVAIGGTENHVHILISSSADALPGQKRFNC